MFISPLRARTAAHAGHKVRKEVKRYPRQYAHEYKQLTNQINAKNHKTHLSPVICLQISKYQEAKDSKILTKKEHTDTGDDILPKKCCNTGPDRDAVDDDNEHPRKDAHCHHLQLRIRVGVIFIALDEVSTTKDRNGKGDNLGVGDGVSAWPALASLI